MYKHLAGYRSSMAEGTALSISDSERLCEILGVGNSDITDASYPEANLLDLPYDENTFDCVISDQVLEHVEGNPLRAVEESFRVVKPGGYVVHTTCLINPIHEYPGDYWRFTPDALAYMADEHGEVLEADGWGNLYACLWMGLGFRYVGIPHADWHPLHSLATHNDSKWLISTWVVARK